MADRISVSVPDEDWDLIEWVDEMVEKKRFSNRSHAIRYALYRLKEDDRRDVLA